MFEKDDDVGFVFSEIIKLIEKLKERTEWKIQKLSCSLEAFPIEANAGVCSF